MKTMYDTCNDNVVNTGFYLYTKYHVMKDSVVWKLIPSQILPRIFQCALMSQFGLTFKILTFKFVLW